MINRNEYIIDVFLGHGDDDPIHNFYKIETQLVNSKDNKVYLGKRDLKICRFCKKNFEQTTFKKQAHLIPEFMGNKYFFSNYECDECNDLFSHYETSLSSYGGILNTFSMVKGKKGYAKHKGTIESTETFEKNGKVIMRINNSDINEPLESVKYDEVTGLLCINTTKNSYVPLDAYKALLKIAFSMLSESEVMDYESIRRWLLNEKDIDLKTNKPFFNVFQRIGGKLFPHPWAILMKKKKIIVKEPCPTHTLLIFYGLFGFQLFMPGNINDQWILDSNRLILPIENHISHSKLTLTNRLNTEVDIIDFSSNKKQINPRHSFSVSFKHGTK